MRVDDRHPRHGSDGRRGARLRFRVNTLAWAACLIRLAACGPSSSPWQGNHRGYDPKTEADGTNIAPSDVAKVPPDQLSQPLDAGRDAKPGGRFEHNEGFIDVTPDPPPFYVPGPFQKGNQTVPSLGAVLLADLDGDEQDEVIFSPTWQEDSYTTPLVYRLQEHTLVRQPLLLPARVSVRAVADMDGDGAADLVLDGPGVSWGDGKGGFSAPKWLSPSEGSNWLPLALADMNGDGWLDILQVASPGLAGNRDVLTYLHAGGRNFLAKFDIVEESQASYVDSLGVARLDEIPTLIVATERINNDQPVPPRFYRKDVKGVWTGFSPFPGAVPASISSGAPMGAAVCDLDGNGRLDFAVALNPDTLFWSDGWKERSDVTGIRRIPIMPGHVYPPMGWAFGCMDIDGDGRLDLLQAYGNDASGFVVKSNEAGPQPIKAWTFGDDWLARDLTATVGLGRLGQWHSMSIGDIDGDGAPDFAVSGWGETPRVYLNRTGVPTAALRLRTRHGQPAVAARVESGGSRWDQVSVSPLSQSDTRAFITRTTGTAVVRFVDGGEASVPIRFGQHYVVQQP